MSTNDFTNPLLKKLNGIETGAQKNEEGTVIDNSYVHTDNNFTNAEKNKIAELQQENTELSSNMPWNTIQGKSLHITDSAKYSKNRLSLSGDMEQEKRSGKNKFKIPESATSNGVTLTKNADGTFNLSGTATAQANFLIPVKNSFVEGKSYTVSSNQSIGAVRYYIHNCTSTGAWKKTQLDFINETTKTKVFGESTTDYISCNIVVVNGATVNLTNVKVQIEEGTATDWEKYGATPSTNYPSMPLTATGVQKIRQFGKNLLPNTAISKTINGITFTVNDDGTVTVNGTATATAVLDVNRQNLLLESGDYMLSGCPSGGSADTYKLDFIAKNTETNIVRYPNDLGQTKYIQVIEPEIITVTRIVVYAGVTLNNAIFKPMLERCKTATDYEAYAEEVNTLNLGTTELCAIKNTNGNVVAQDKPVYRNNKWQWEKNVGKKVFNGTEDFDLWGNGTDSAYRMIYKGLTSTIKKNGLILSNFYSTKLAPQLYDFEVGIATDANGNIIIHDNDFITTDSYKTNLAQKYTNGTPLTAYYPLATPEYIDCTAEQSAVLDKLYNNFELAKGTNNIIVESENGVEVNLELEYMQDLQTKLNLLEAMCVSNVSQEV